MTFTQLTRVACFLVLLASAACIPHGVVNLTDTQKVAFGSWIPPNSWPFLAQISIKGSYPHFCGGSVLNEFYILTAAHCIKGKDDYYPSFRVTAGEHDLTVVEGSEQVREVEQFILHPEYNIAGFYENDVALLKLKSPLDLSTSKVKAIALNSGRSFPPADTVCSVAGWGDIGHGEGSPVNPLFAEITVLSKAECLIKMAGSTDYIFDSTLCTWENDHAGPCAGDSGGPIVCTCPCCDDPVHVGVVSWIYGPCSGLGGYARTSYFHTWITDTMAMHHPWFD